MRLVAAFVASALLVPAPAALADGGDAGGVGAALVVSQFHGTLLSVMKDAATLGFQGRFAKLEPAIDRTFDLPLMTRVVVGMRWSDWTAEQRDQVTRAFRRFVVSTYARRFDGYSGEGFEQIDAKTAPGGALVQTELTRPADTPVKLTYRLREEDDGQYKVIDVFLTGTISELATRRSEFGAILQHDGYQGLIKALDAKADNDK